MLSSILAALRAPEPTEGSQQRPPRYAGEDTTPTTDREILGWYSYGIAAEVFAVCGVGAYGCNYCAITSWMGLNG